MNPYHLALCYSALAAYGLVLWWLVNAVPKQAAPEDILRQLNVLRLDLRLMRGHLNRVTEDVEALSDRTSENENGLLILLRDRHSVSDGTDIPNPFSDLPA